MGRHMGHTFVYLQDAVQDCRAITIQLLAEAQQGRQAVQVRLEISAYMVKMSCQLIRPFTLEGNAPGSRTASCI